MISDRGGVYGFGYILIYKSEGVFEGEVCELNEKGIY